MEKYEYLLNLLSHGHYTPYLGIILVLLISGFGFPMPEDIPLLIAGYLCHLGYANVWVMLPIAFCSVLSSDFMLFFIGRRYGRHVQNIPLLGRHLTEARFKRAEDFFHKWGGISLFLTRFFPGIRSAGFLSAGACKIPFWKLLVYDGAAALISVPLLVLAAWYFGDHIDQVLICSGRANMVITVSLVIAAIVVGYLYFRRVKAKAKIPVPQN
jgi:membrane protein DedA with SNARE-associated domain